MEEIYIQLLRKKLSEIRELADEFCDKTLSDAVCELEDALDHSKKILREKTRDALSLDE